MQPVFKTRSDFRSDFRIQEAWIIEFEDPILRIVILGILTLLEGD